MRLIGSTQTEQGKLLLVYCPCGRQFSHPADNWFVICPKCGKIKSCHKLKGYKR